MKPRIALLSDYPPDFVSFAGGVETATAGLLEGLRAHQADFEFHVISLPRGSDSDEHHQSDGFHFHFLALKPPWLRPRYPFRILRIAGELRRLQPALVHCQGSIEPAVAAIWGGYSRLYTIHGIRRQEAKTRSGWERLSACVDAVFEPAIYRGFEDFVCISAYARRIVGSHGRKHLIPNAVRSSFFAVRRDVSPGSPRLLFVGSLSSLKRPIDLIEAHRVLRHEFSALKTVFCGEAENRHYLEELSAGADEGVEFAGRLDQVALMRELARATALVLPSAQENAPLVVAEAMAAGVPVVATMVGGIPEMLDGELAETLYAAGDSEHLTAILRAALSDPGRTSALAEAGRRKAQKQYQAGQVGRQTVSVYREMLANGREHT